MALKNSKMEEKLKGLISASSQANRVKQARSWQEQGKKVIGVLDVLVPEEIIYAAGMLPWRIHGTWKEDVSLASMYRLPQTCCFLTHILQSVLEGELDFLDGMAGSNRDEDFLHLRDYWLLLAKTPFIRILDVPIIEKEAACRRFGGKIRELTAALAEFGNVEVDDDSLRKAIAVYDKSRALLRQAYELRKKEIPPLTGGEYLGLTMAAAVMPRDEFNKSLEELLPYLEKRQPAVGRTRPRVLLSSDLLDNPGYIDMVEGVGCLVAMDDMDTGSRYFWEKVGDVGEDPAYTLAKRYLKNRLARMVDWESQAELLVGWVKEFKIDGVLDLPDMYDYPREFRRRYIEGKLKEAGIPWVSFERDYHLANAGQLKTRIGAFLEMLGSGG
jgi:benzoyl-CoA reductase/2-hydroxyglutaryl-CoA dehydratase subunit BcrC/BadD/HgdB